MNPYLRLKQSSYLRETYPYALGVLDSVWAEMGIDLNNPPVISAKVAYVRPMAAYGNSDCLLELYVDDEPMRISVTASKEASINTDDLTAMWKYDHRALIPKHELLPVSGAQIVPFETAVNEAYDSWIPPVPTFEETEAFLGNKKELLFQLLWIDLIPASVATEPGRYSPGRGQLGYISFIHWFDGNTYFVIRDLPQVYTDARQAVFAAYEALMNRAGKAEMPVGEIQTDLIYLETFIEELVNFSGRTN